MSAEEEEEGALAATVETEPSIIGIGSRINTLKWNARARARAIVTQHQRSRSAARYATVPCFGFSLSWDISPRHLSRAAALCHRGSCKWRYHVSIDRETNIIKWHAARERYSRGAATRMRMTYSHGNAARINLFDVLLYTCR